MRAAEFLRGLADMLSALEADKPAHAPVVVNVNAGGSNAPHSNEPTPMEKDDALMVPPLQQKLEVMKKLAGIDSTAHTAATADEDEPFGE